MSDGLDNELMCAGYPLGVSSLFMGWLCDWCSLYELHHVRVLLSNRTEFSSYNIKENVLCTTIRVNKWSENKKNTKLDILRNFGVWTSLDPIHSNIHFHIFFESHTGLEWHESEKMTTECIFCGLGNPRMCCDTLLWSIFLSLRKLLHLIIWIIFLLMRIMKIYSIY